MALETLDIRKLVRIENYTDNERGEVIRYVPVDDTGERDLTRTEEFFGRADIPTENGGVARVAFPIPAPNLGNAIFIFVHALKLEVDRRNAAVTAQREAEAKQIALPAPPAIVTP